MDRKIIILAPVYNEGASVRKQIDDILEFCRRHINNFHLVIIDDGSNDGTQEILREFTNRNNIEIIRHNVNRGIGGALLTGLERVKEFVGNDDVVITMETDNTNELAHLLNIKRFIEQQYDIVICSRLHPQGIFIGFPFYRKVFTILVNKLLRLCFPYDGIKDYSMIYRGYKGELIKKLFTYYGNTPLKFSGFASTSELLLRLLFLTPNLKIKEIPTVYRYDLKCSKSKMHVGKTIVAYIFLIIRFLLYKVKL